MELSAAQLAALVRGTVVGDGDVRINNFAKIEEATEGCVTFLANPKYTHYIYTTRASAVLVRRDFVPERDVPASLIQVDDPYATLAELLTYVNKQLQPAKVGVEQPCFIADGVDVPDDVYVGAFAYVAKGVKLGKGVKIYPQVYVGDDVTIGDNTILYPGVKVYHGCVIGRDCILQAGCVIGGDGFGFAPRGSEFVKIAQVGNVVICDNVEIGANTTIDRATMGSTVIGESVKLDNLIQVAHNVEIGDHTMMAAQVGIAGSAKIGSYNMVGGQVGFTGHIKVGDRNQIGAQSGVHTSMGDDKALIGSPPVPVRDFARQVVNVKKLSSLYDDVRALKKAVEELANCNNKESI